MSLQDGCSLVLADVRISVEITPGINKIAIIANTHRKVNDKIDGLLEDLCCVFMVEFRFIFSFHGFHIPKCSLFEFEIYKSDKLC